MMPVIAWNALHATRILREAMRVLQDARVAGLRVDEARCRELLDRSTALATALSPYIGYAATADIAKTAVATGRSIRDLVRERGLIPGRSARRDSLGGSDDVSGRARARARPPMFRQRGPMITRALVALVLAAASLQTPSSGGDAPQHGRLFDPKDLGHAGGSGSRRVAAAGPDHGRPRHRRRQRRR